MSVWPPFGLPTVFKRLVVIDARNCATFISVFFNNPQQQDGGCHEHYLYFSLLEEPNEALELGIFKFLMEIAHRYLYRYYTKSSSKAADRSGEPTSI
jgi:hypothetical protein